MIDLPPLALSVRQPWAWAIIYAGKDVENRSAFAIGYMKPLAGRRAIHASKNITRHEYEYAAEFMASHGIQCPPAADLLRGGIIGSVEVVGRVKQSASPWFFGPHALVLRDPRPCTFIPAVGALGYFRWRPDERAAAPAPLKWMGKPAPSAPAPAGDLFYGAEVARR